MIVYYGGHSQRGELPQDILRERANIMWSFFDNIQKPQQRFLKIVRARLRRKQNAQKNQS